jgi:hypothetical protein
VIINSDERFLSLWLFLRYKLLCDSLSIILHLRFYIFHQRLYILILGILADICLIFSCTFICVSFSSACYIVYIHFAIYYYYIYRYKFHVINTENNLVTSVSLYREGMSFNPRPPHTYIMDGNLLEFKTSCALRGC